MENVSKRAKARKPKFIRTKKPRIDKDVHEILNAVAFPLFHLTFQKFNQKIRFIKFSQSKAERKIKFKDPKTKKESSRMQEVTLIFYPNSPFLRSPTMQ